MSHYTQMSNLSSGIWKPCPCERRGIGSEISLPLFSFSGVEMLFPQCHYCGHIPIVISLFTVLHYHHIFYQLYFSYPLLLLILGVVSSCFFWPCVVLPSFPPFILLELLQRCSLIFLALLLHYFHVSSYPIMFPSLCHFSHCFVASSSSSFFYFSCFHSRTSIVIFNLFFFTLNLCFCLIVFYATWRLTSPKNSIPDSVDGFLLCSNVKYQLVHRV